jgi:hypothetical protein
MAHPDMGRSVLVADEVLEVRNFAFLLVNVQAIIQQCYTRAVVTAVF